MAITEWVNFDGALDASKNYTTGASELPANTQVGVGGVGAAISAPGGSWGTRNVLKASYSDVFDQAGSFPATSAPVRLAMLIEPNGQTSAQKLVSVLFVDGEGGATVTDKNDGTIFVEAWNAAATASYSVSISRPSGVYALELVLDYGNPTPSERMKMRAWTLGGAVPAFTLAAQDNAGWAVPTAVSNVRLRNPDYNYGQLIVSDDVAEDLSALIEQNDYSAGGDTTAPILSSPTLTVDSNTSVAFGATSNEDGAAHAVVRLVSDPAATQQEIVDGTYANAVVVPADVDPITANTPYQFAQVTGLTGNTQYAVDQVATDAAGNISAVNTQVFTTQSAEVQVTISGGANLTGLDYVLFDSQDLATAGILKQGAGESTDASGNLVIDVNDVSVTDGQAVYYVIGDTGDTQIAGGPATVSIA